MFGKKNAKQFSTRTAKLSMIENVRPFQKEYAQQLRKNLARISRTKVVRRFLFLPAKSNWKNLVSKYLNVTLNTIGLVKQ
jgi:hypothetical protein